jgi:hypothetical protein
MLNNLNFVNYFLYLRQPCYTFKKNNFFKNYFLFNNLIFLRKKFQNISFLKRKKNFLAITPVNFKNKKFKKKNFTIILLFYKILMKHNQLYKLIKSLKNILQKLTTDFYKNFFLEYTKNFELNYLFDNNINKTRLFF